MEKQPTTGLDPNKRYTVCTCHLLDDLHLHRRQFQIKVIYLGSNNISRPKIKEELAHKYNISDRRKVFISGFTTNGPFSTGFGLT
jgi:ribosomal protein S24E